MPVLINKWLLNMRDSHKTNEEEFGFIFITANVGVKHLFFLKHRWAHYSHEQHFNEGTHPVYRVHLHSTLSFLQSKNLLPPLLLMTY